MTASVNLNKGMCGIAILVIIISSLSGMILVFSEDGEAATRGGSGTPEDPYWGTFGGLTIYLQCNQHDGAYFLVGTVFRYGEPSSGEGFYDISPGFGLISDDYTIVGTVTKSGQFDAHLKNPAQADEITPAHFTIYFIDEPVTPTHTVVFDSNGGSEVPNATTDTSGLVKEPEDPVLADHVFAGWYTSDGEPFDFSQPVTEDITLHAQWVDELVFTTVPTSDGIVKAVSGLAGTILCDATLSSDYTSLLWDLGDGTVSDNTYVTHYYSEPGTYTVTLTAYNNYGTDVTTFTVEVPENLAGGGGAMTICSFGSPSSSASHSPSWYSHGFSEPTTGAVA